MHTTTGHHEIGTPAELRLLEVSVTSTPRPATGFARRSPRLARVLLAAAIAAALAIVLLVVPGRRAGAAESTSAWCADVVNTTTAAVPPVASRLGTQVTLHVAATAAERQALIDRFGLDSTGLTIAGRMGTGPFRIDVIVDCTEITSRQQLTALRFLTLHELAHVMQYAFQADPLAQPRDEHEHEADCAANAMMRSIFGTTLPMSYGAHGGCTAGRFDATAAWVASLFGGAAPAETSPASRTRGLKAWAGAKVFTPPTRQG